MAGGLGNMFGTCCFFSKLVKRLLPHSTILFMVEPIPIGDASLLTFIISSRHDTSHCIHKLLTASLRRVSRGKLIFNQITISVFRTHWKYDEDNEKQLWQSIYYSPESQKFFPKNIFDLIKVDLQTLFKKEAKSRCQRQCKARHFLVIFNQLVHFFQFCLSHFWRMLFVVHHDFHIIYFRLCRVCCIYYTFFSFPMN